MKPLRHTLNIYQGQTFLTTLRVVTLPDETPVDFSGHTARMHVRRELADAEPLLVLATSDLAGRDGDIVLGSDGTIVLRLEATVTADLPTGLELSQWVYDLEVVDPAQTPAYVERVVEGTVVVYPEVTR